jgi:hypothetical protein
MANALKGFSDWLVATWVSVYLQPIGWVVPTAQTVHILAITAVLASASMVNLRLMGVGARSQSMVAVSGRFVPWVWGALAVLIVSGSILIIIEPARPLLNPVFYLKLALIAGVAMLTVAIGHTLSLDAEYWERSPGRRASALALASLSWVLWIGVICAGRWIAYTSSLAFG